MLRIPGHRDTLPASDRDSGRPQAEPSLSGPSRLCAHFAEPHTVWEGPTARVREAPSHDPYRLPCYQSGGPYDRC